MWVAVAAVVLIVPQLVGAFVWWLLIQIARDTRATRQRERD